MKIKRQPLPLIESMAAVQPVFIDEPPKPMQLGSQEQVAKVLAGDDGPKPWCTCGTSGSFSFDQQLGIFVHVSEKVLCYKPSKAYYTAAVQAGIVRE